MPARREFRRGVHRELGIVQGESGTYPASRMTSLRLPRHRVPNTGVTSDPPRSVVGMAATTHRGPAAARHLAADGTRPPSPFRRASPSEADDHVGSQRAGDLATSSAVSTGTADGRLRTFPTRAVPSASRTRLPTPPDDKARSGHEVSANGLRSHSGTLPGSRRTQGPSTIQQSPSCRVWRNQISLRVLGKLHSPCSVSQIEDPALLSLSSTHAVERDSRTRRSTTGLLDLRLRRRRRKSHDERPRSRARSEA